MKQIVAHKKLGALQGILLVLGLLIALALINFLSLNLLARLIGYNPASLVFWGLGGLVAWFVLRVYILNIIYEMNEDVLRVSRKYGRRERVIEDIYLSKLLFVGDPAEAKKRYPQAKKLNAAHAGCKAPVTAVVYQNSVGIRVALMQPDAEIRARLLARAKGR